MKLTRRSVLATSLATVLVPTVAACRTGGTGGEPEDRQLVVGASVAPDSMDPSTAGAAAIPQVLLYNVYETLVKIDGRGQLQPLLANEWSVTPDGLSYTFTLRSQASFASGAPVDAEAVVASITRIKDDPDIVPVLKSRIGALETVTAVNPTTVRFDLSHPSRAWLYAMAQTAGIIYDPAGIDSLATTPAGSGPFVFDSWVQGQQVVLKRNDNYWGTPSKLAGVTFQYYTDANAMNSAMLSDGLDIISNVAAPQALDQFTADDRFTVLEGTTTGEIVLGFNHSVDVMQNVNVRKAVLHGIDREALRDAVWGGKGPLIGSMVPPTDPWYEDLTDVNPYDPELARQDLAAAGYQPGELSLRLRVPTLPYATPAATYIASQLAEVGINVQVEELEFPATWIDEVMTKSNYDMTIVAHVETRDIVQFANPDYYWHYNNPQFQQLIETADEAVTEQDQIAAMQQAARILAEDAAAGFLWLLPNLVVTKADITGVDENAPSLSFDMTGVMAPPN